MKKIFIFFTAFVFLVPFLSSSESGDYYSYSYAHLSYVKGDVFVQRAADLGYEEGVVNLPIVEGDKLGSREGRAEIHFGRKNYLRVNDNTQIDFATLPRRAQDQIKLHLLTGSIFLRISFLVEEKSFEIHTPDASFYILDVGLYRLNVRENVETEIFVYDGAVEAAAEEGSLLVKEEQRLVASNGEFRSGATHFYASLDDSFSQWNDYRDSLLKKRVARTYLPSELYEYEAELANHGRWVYERSYGYVWVPHVVHHDWRPFYYGKWVWYPIIGWTWVSYDPWGWCAYRYGRWHWRLGLGWYWIPTRIWGPAWVHWHWGYDYIGWCPLSYYGYPVVIINNYFYDRYYSRYYPLNSRALTVIRRSQLQARRVSRVALRQNQVNQLKKISLSAKQPGIKPTINKISKNSAAARTLSRENLRKVSKGYGSGKTVISPSRLKSSISRSSSEVTQRKFSSDKARTLSKGTIRSSTSRTTSRFSPKYSSSSLRKSQASERTSSRLSRSTSTRPTIKIYPSRKTSSSSRSMSSSSSSLRTSTKRSSGSYRSSSGSSDRASVKIYKPSSSSYSSSKYSSARSNVSGERESTGRSYSKSSYSSRVSPSRSYSSSYRSYTTPSRSYTKSSSSSRYVSPKSSYSPSRSYSSRSYTKPSRSYSRSSSSSRYVSPKRSYSSSRSSSSRSSSPSRSTVSRSSSRSSSSSSSSRGSIKKK